MKVFFGQNENKNRKISKSKNTKPELKVRAHLRYNKVSYRIHDKMLPGTPDIIIPRYKIAININGCFWHQHGCTNTKVPNKRRDFWENKFDKIKSRDAGNRLKLENFDYDYVQPLHLFEKHVTKTLVQII